MHDYLLSTKHFYEPFCDIVKKNKHSFKFRTWLIKLTLVWDCFIVPLPLDEHIFLWKHILVGPTLSGVIRFNSAVTYEHINVSWSWEENHLSLTKSYATHSWNYRLLIERISRATNKPFAQFVTSLMKAICKMWIMHHIHKSEAYMHNHKFPLICPCFIQWLGAWLWLWLIVIYYTLSTTRGCHHFIMTLDLNPVIDVLMSCWSAVFLFLFF